MRVVDLIEKKRDGKVLSKEEIEFFVHGVTDGSIPDYQISAWLMAVYFSGMTAEETTSLTLAMANSGGRLDLSCLPGIKVDKHSTGGVGDKTTLVVAPIVAACGVTVAKLSGRGLGFTGGTVDKLESIPGLRTEFTIEEFLALAAKNGIVVIGQSKALAPADKKLYALRDVTATVESIPLICGSIMSKKLAAGCDRILLDVKVGTGAFMKTEERAKQLARAMVDVGYLSGVPTTAIVTEMDIPLGENVGNALEVIESVKVLIGECKNDLFHECSVIAAEILKLAGVENPDEKVTWAINSGAAFEKLCTMVEAQGGDVSYIRDLSKFPPAAFSREVKSPADAYMTAMDTAGIGISSAMLGAGRETMTDELDYAAGIIITKKTGDSVSVGEIIATLYSNTERSLDEAEKKYLASISFGSEKPEMRPLILGIITKNG